MNQSLKMADPIECNEASNLCNQQFRLDKINEIKDYFIAEINEWKRINEWKTYIALIAYKQLYCFFWLPR